jgi:hypothetical protein
LAESGQFLAMFDDDDDDDGESDPHWLEWLFPENGNGAANLPPPW